MFRIFTFAFVLLPLLAGAQKHDFVWCFGRDIGIKKGHLLDFNYEPALSDSTEQEITFNLTTASVCDENGRFLFSTNGCFVTGSDLKKMPNSDSLNVGYYFNLFCNIVLYKSYPGNKSSFFLPNSKDGNKYHLFHGERISLGDSLSSATSPFFETILDKTLNNNIGGVVSKRRVVLEDTLAIGQIAANRHANGRDWWIVVPEFSTSRHYIFLFDTSGIQLYREQWIGEVAHADFASGTAVFSPDGTMYARYDPYNGLNIFDFDRCRGLFSNPRHGIYDPSPYGHEGSLWASGDFAPNSRYLYVSDALRIWQYDLYASDWKASKIEVAHLEAGLPTLSHFFKGQLAPDGKIYYAAWNFLPYLHVIDKPNERGKACEVKQLGLEMVHKNLTAIPYFPNYRLGVEEGSFCDTIGKPPLELADLIEVFPSPFSSLLRIENLSRNQIYIEIFDNLGRKVHLDEMLPIEAVHELNTSLWASGIYYYRVYDKSRKMVKSGKLIKPH